MLDMGVEYRWTPENEKFKKKLTEFGQKAVFVGFPESAGKHKVPQRTGKGKKKVNEHPVSVAQVAAWNEFGTIHMPARPFMRDTIELNKDKFRELLKQAGRDILKGEDTEQTLNKVGVVAKALMQKQIDEGSYAPNAPSTIRIKGSSKPLIDTGQMRQSVNYVVR